MWIRGKKCLQALIASALKLLAMKQIPRLINVTWFYVVIERFNSKLMKQHETMNSLLHHFKNQSIKSNVKALFTNHFQLEAILLWYIIKKIKKRNQTKLNLITFIPFMHYTTSIETNEWNWIHRSITRFQ